MGIWKLAIKIQKNLSLSNSLLLSLYFLHLYIKPTRNIQVCIYTQILKIPLSNFKDVNSDFKDQI